MKERIIAIMEAENMTSARFADSLQIGRAVISHILNGRNNPSLEVITRILAKMPQINSDWLLTGNGSMYKNDSKPVSPSEKFGINDLFSQPLENNVNQPHQQNRSEYDRVEAEPKELKVSNEIVNERIVYKETPQKKIRQIIVYYSDNTFEAFSHG